MRRIIYILLIVTLACEEPPGPSGVWNLDRTTMSVMSTLLKDTLFSAHMFYDSTFTDSYMFLDGHKVGLNNFPKMPDRWNYVTDVPAELVFDPDLVPPEDNNARGRTDELFRQNNAPEFVFNYRCVNSRVFYDQINMDNLGYQLYPCCTTTMQLKAVQVYYVRLDSEDTISDRRVHVLIDYWLTWIDQ